MEPARSIEEHMETREDRTMERFIESNQRKWYEAMSLRFEIEKLLSVSLDLWIEIRLANREDSDSVYCERVLENLLGWIHMRICCPVRIPGVLFWRCWRNWTTQRKA